MVIGEKSPAIEFASAREQMREPLDLAPLRGHHHESFCRPGVMAMNSVRLMFVAATAALISTGSAPVSGIEPAVPDEVAFVDVRVFDSHSDSLTGPTTVLVRGDPLEDLELIADPEQNLLVIMKGGTIYKQIAAEPD